MVCIFKLQCSFYHLFFLLPNTGKQNFLTQLWVPYFLCFICPSLGRIIFQLFVHYQNIGGRKYGREGGNPEGLTNILFKALQEKLT